MHTNATNMDSNPPPATHQEHYRDHDHDHDHDPLSPVFADSAIDMDVSPPPQPPPPLSHVPDDETLERTVRLADRLADLAHRTVDKKHTATATTTTGGNSSSRFSKDHAVVLQRCLDTIQKTLLVFDEDDEDDKEKEGGYEEKGDYDPRPGLTQELTKYRRPQSTTTTSTVNPETQPASPSSSPQPPSIPDNSNDATTAIAEQQKQQQQPQQEKQFTALLDEVSTLGSELDQRRNESFYIYNLFTLQTQRMERRICGLEDEVRELLVYTYHCIGNWTFLRWLC